jgi:hypothetical protein
LTFLDKLCMYCVGLLTPFNQTAFLSSIVMQGCIQIERRRRRLGRLPLHTHAGLSQTGLPTAWMPIFLLIWLTKKVAIRKIFFAHTCIDPHKGRQLHILRGRFRIGVISCIYHSTAGSPAGCWCDLQNFLPCVSVHSISITHSHTRVEHSIVSLLVKWQKLACRDCRGEIWRYRFFSSSEFPIRLIVLEFFPLFGPEKVIALLF